MATIARFRKQVPTDIWCTKERLALACSVMRSGDQNWVSVSRAIKPYGESTRPPDWFSQKNCALQYSDLLEKVETPKRKRSERSERETPGDLIVRKLTIERIEELKKIVQEEQQKYKKLKRDIEIVKSGQVDDKIKEVWEEMCAQKVAAEEAAKRAAEKRAEDAAARQAALARTPGKPVAIPNKVRKLKLKVGLTMSDQEDSTQEDTDNESIKVEDDSMSSTPAVTPISTPILDVKQRTTPPSSPLLPSLLHSKNELAKSLQSQDSPLFPEIKEEGDSDFPSMDDIKLEPVEEVEVITTETPTSTGTIASSSEVEMEVDVAPAISDMNTLMTTLAADQSTTSSMSTTSASQSSNSTVTIATPPILSCRWDIPTSPAVEEPDQDEDDDNPELILKNIFPERKQESNDGSEKLLASVLDEDPASPASSIMSNETDSGSGKGRGKGRRPGRPRKINRRDPGRIKRGRLGEEKKEESVGKPSDAETTDDEDTLNMSDDAAVTMTPRPALSISESIPNSPASISQSDTEDEKAYKIWKKSIMLVWRAAANHKYANVFLHPVTNEIAPGYTTVVSRPCNLTRIKKNVENGNIRTTAEFQRDMMLMFTNAIMYNNADQDVYHMAYEMYNDVMLHIEQYVNTQMMVQTEAKVLRTSRRSEVTSDKEEKDEPKKRKSTSSEPSEQSGGKTKKQRKP